MTRVMAAVEQSLERDAEKSAPLTSQVFAYTDFVARHGDAWRELTVRTRAALDLGQDWADSLIAGHSVNVATVRVVTLTRGAELVAVLPITLSTSKILKLKVQVVEPLINLFSMHQGMLTSEPIAQVLPQLFAAIWAMRPAPLWMELRRLPRGSAVAEALQAYAKRVGAHMEDAPGLTPPYLTITGTWEEFLAGKSGNFRSNLKRKPKRLAQLGAVDLRFLTEPAQMPAFLDAMREIEESSWKSDAGSAITSRAWEWAFYRELVQRLAPHNGLLCTLLTVDGRAAAYDLSTVAHGVASCLKTSFDSRWSEGSPGLVLRAALMERIFRDGFHEYDFLGKNERYKLEWSEVVRSHSQVRIYNPHGARGWLLQRLAKLRKRPGEQEQS
jgi:CelD/BcsL family acetyltransferase involved in cellulose biosynthesis